MGCLFKRLWQINNLSKEQAVLGNFEEKIDLLIEKIIREESKFQGLEKPDL